MFQTNKRTDRLSLALSYKLVSTYTYLCQPTILCSLADAKLVKKMTFVDENVIEVSSDNLTGGYYVETDFEWALRVKNTRVLKKLFNESQTQFASTKDNFGRSPFHLACMRGQLLIVQILLQNVEKTDIDINEKDHHEMTGYHYSCVFEQQQVQELLETEKLTLGRSHLMNLVLLILIHHH